MKYYRLLLVYGVILAWLALLSTVKAQQLSPVRIALAGTMEVVVVRDIGPAFTAATGYPVELTRAPSVQLANRIVKGEIKPDVYLNSDAIVMELLMGPANNDRSRWYLPILRSRTVIAYSPNSKWSFRTGFGIFFSQETSNSRFDLNRGVGGRATQLPDPKAEKGRRKIAVKLGISNGVKTELIEGLQEGQKVVLQ